MPSDTPPAEQNPPGAARLLPIVPIVLGVTGLVRWLDGSAHIDLSLVLGLAAGGAGLIGIPMLFWALDHGRTRLRHLVALGALAGALPLAAVVASGVAGRFVWGRTLAYVRWFLGIGAPIPLVGAMPWREFAAAEMQAILTGVASAAVYWAMFVRRKRSPPG